MPVSYGELSAQQKHQYLWNQIEINGTPHDSLSDPDLFAFVDGLTSNLDPVFEHREDVFPNRRKMVHQQGLVGRVVLEPFADCTIPQHPFGGIFATGSVHGIVRLSSGATGIFLPAIALKILRDGVPSANILAMHAVDGPEQFFAQDLCTRLEPSPTLPGQFIVDGKFKHTSEFNLYLGQLDASSIDTTGRVAQDACVPYALRFEPAVELSTRDVGGVSWSDQILSVPPDSRLYTLYGMDRPKELGGSEYPIGQLRLAGSSVISPWADQNLFFPHERPEDVLRVHPEWEPYIGEKLGQCPFQASTIYDAAVIATIPVYRALNTVHAIRTTFSRDSERPLLRTLWGLVRMQAGILSRKLMFPTYGSFVSSHTVGNIVDSARAASSSTADRCAQWILSQNQSLFDFDTTVYDECHWYDLFLSWLNSFGMTVTELVMRQYEWPSESTDVRRARLGTWYKPEPDHVPIYSNIRLLEFVVNNVDLLDVMYSSQKEGEEDRFEIRTDFLNLYRQKGINLYRQKGSPKLLLGATVSLIITPDGLRVQQVCCGGLTYGREDLPPHIANQIVQGLVAYMTAATHALHLHYNTHRAVTLLHQHLPTTHPIRQVLRPTEVGVTAVVGLDAIVLTRKGGTLEKMLPFAYDGGGLDKLVDDYEPWDPMNTEDRRTVLMCGVDGGGHQCPVIRDLRQWWTYIRGHMDHILRVLYQSDADLLNDTAVITWLTESVSPIGSALPPRMQLSITMSRFFFNLVRHSFVSNTYVSHIIQHQFILDPLPVVVYPALVYIFVATTTTMQWTRLSKGFSDGCDDREIRRALRLFYDGFGELSPHIQHPLGKPDMIEVSIAK